MPQVFSSTGPVRGCRDYARCLRHVSLPDRYQAHNPHRKAAGPVHSFDRNMPMPHPANVRTRPPRYGPAAHRRAPKLAAVLLAVSTAFLVGIVPAEARAQARSVDWDACASALDTLRDDADTAHTDAQEAADEQEELRDCRRDPAGDVYGDKCQTRLRNYRDASDTAADSADAAIDSAQDAQSACTAMTSQERLAASQARLCNSYRRLFSLSASRGRSSCEKARGKQWCDVCFR